ncbi:MAG: hypothetical protein EON60_08155 [Alphaproteobacteria bacterium]|nr:MAG: hypothetical protein EON60_08155 [Alphaproteobacteria bacterium]
MPITFNTNLAALGAQRNISISSNAASSSLSKLSSGSRIPQAKDDAAGLAIGSKLKSEIAGLTQAANNTGQAISLLQIADGALATIGDVLQRMKTLAVQSSSGQLDDSSRALLNQEYTNLKSEVDRVAGITNFNGTKLLSGQTTVTGGAVGITGGVNVLEVADGFEGFEFAENVNGGALQVTYDATTRVMSVKDMTTGITDTATLSSGAILEDVGEAVKFNTLGVTINLNEDFDKTASIVVAASTSTNADITASTIKINSVTQSKTNPFDFSDIAAALTVTFTTTDAEAATAAATIGGVSFSSVITTDLTATGAKTLTLADANGNQIEIGYTVATAVTDADAQVFTVNDVGNYVGTNAANVANKDFSFKVGTGVTANDSIAFSVNKADTVALGLNTSGIATAATADAAIGAVNSAITAIASRRAEVGAAQSRLDFASTSISVAIENTSAATSAIMDVDVSAEITNFTNKNVLMQAGISLLGQANQQPALLLRLLQ